MSDPSNSNKELATTKPYKLILSVKRFIDFVWFLNVGALIIWPIAVLVIGLSIPENPEERHTDVNFYMNFKVYPKALSELVGSRENSPELIEGRGKIKVNNTKSQLAWYLSNGIDVIMGVIALFGIACMRKLFTNLLKVRHLMKLIRRTSIK